MLPDFPRIKLEFQKMLVKLVEDLSRQAPFLSQIRKVVMFEGSGLGSQYADGNVDESPFERIQAEFNVEREEVIKKGFEAYTAGIANMAGTLKAEQEKMAFQRIQEIAEKIGNVTDGQGRPFDFEMFYEGLEKVQIDFDEAGHPRLPTLFVGPELGIKIRAKLPEWSANPEYNKRMETLFAKKQREWNDRESNRKLVD